MGNRRFAQVSTSDEDEDVPPPSSRTRKSEENKEQQSLRQSKRKRIKLQEEEDYEEPEEERKASKRERRDKGKVREAEKPRNDGVEDEEEEEEEEEQPQEDAKPVGEPVRFSGKGRGRRSHYEAFEFDGNKYELEDPVLLTPEDTNQKPYVAIIKEITQSKDGSMMVTGQWFYRPEEADRKGGGNWLSRDTRELFYSFHRDEVPAESVMHKCVVHFVPIHKQLPNRKQHPGFIVQKVYDTVERKLWKLTDKDYEDNKQHEIDLLVQKTRARLGDLPDIEPEETAAREQEDQLKAKRSLRKKNISPLDVSREEDSTTRSDQYVKAETPGSCTSNASEYYNILSKFKALTGETHRDKWLERLLHGLQYICNSADSIHADQNGKGGCKGVDHESEDKSVGTENGSREKGQKNGKSFIWPDTAIAAVTALEKASHDTLSSDFQKYNQKLRQLLFNLKSTALLARRLLNGELEPSKILNMSPNELKEGLTAEEMAKKEPDELEQMQMTDARCSRCNECKVGLRDIIQAGHGDRYQLECIACGHSWYASRDEASSLTIDGPGSAAKSVGIVPLATAKFDSLEKNLLSPRESEKLANDVLKKSSEAYMPVLEAQRSFGKSKTEENSDASNAKKADEGLQQSWSSSLIRHKMSSKFAGFHQFYCTKKIKKPSPAICAAKSMIALRRACIQGTQGDAKGDPSLAVDLAMGLEVEMDCDKISTMGLSPNTVLLPPRHCSNIETRKTKGKHIRKDELLRVREGFTEISFRCYRSSSCKSTPAGPVGLEGNIELKRGSIYQTSNEVRKMKKMGAIEGRKKIEFPCSNDTSLPFRVLDSLCSSDEESSGKRNLVLSVNSTSNTLCVCKPFMELCPAGDFIEFGLQLDTREKQSAETPRRDTVEDLNFRCGEVVGPLDDGNNLLERDTILTFQKSHSAKVEMAYPPSPSESDHSSRASSKTRFNPIRRMFDPLMKSKSVRSPLCHAVQHNQVKKIGTENVRRERAFRKSLLHDFSNTAQNSEFNSQIVEKDKHRSAVAHSPVHLHGLLKLEHKQGVPFFEFSLSSPEDVIVARTWKADNDFNWVYTFHSFDGRKRSNVSGWGSNDRNRECSMVGQMQVSCYICSELRDGGVFDNSMVTEFVLYDIAHASQSVSAQELLKCSSDATPPKDTNQGIVEGSNESDSVKSKEQAKIGFSNKSNPLPWASGDLPPNLEIAAIVIQVPFEKRESLKYKGHRVSDKMHSNLLNLSMVEQRRKDRLEIKCSEKVKVVIPTGNHGLPSPGSRGPSSLLDRWRLGGGCDCGGWDMACPLTVFSDTNIHDAEDRPLLDNQQPLELFVQGAKVSTPALTMMFLEEGLYAVDFHAQLSTLQAFSICVGILHGSEASIAAAQERSTKLPHCNSLKVLIEDEVKFLIEAVTEEEKKKFSKRAEDIPQTYMINPPFSPIARV